MRVNHQIGYSTTLKMAQIRTDKGLLVEDESVRPRVFKPVRAEAQTQLQLIDDLIQRTFDGSASKLVMRAAVAKRISALELLEIKYLIDRENKR